MNKILVGSALEQLHTLPAESVDMCITSPPYWGLRDYGTATWKGGDPACDHVANPNATKAFGNPEFDKNRPSRKATKTPGYYADICPKCGAEKTDAQLGLEKTFNEYIDKLCTIFDEVMRVLKPTGTCWVNLGDTYGGMGDKGKWKDPKYKNGRNGQTVAVNRTATKKSLCQIPSRFAIEMCNRGWILRNEIIWHKPNCMPSSAKDRFTVDFEKLFFFTKNKKYYFETQMEKAVANRWGGHKPINLDNSKDKDNQFGGLSRERDMMPEERNKRCVWKVNTKPYKEAHFAVYPEALIESPIKAGCPSGGVVLDSFIGSGTTAAVAKRLGRRYIGIELNPEYVPLIERRLDAVQLDLLL